MRYVYALAHEWFVETHTRAEFDSPVLPALVADDWILEEISRAASNPTPQDP